MSLLVGSDTVSSKASHDGGSHFVPADVISASFQQITLKTGFSFVEIFFCEVFELRLIQLKCATEVVFGIRSC